MTTTSIARPLFLTCLACSSTALAQTQTSPARLDPALVTRTATPTEPPRATPPVPAIDTTVAVARPSAQASGMQVGAIKVDGGEDLPSDQMVAAIAPFIGHRLSAADAQDLLTVVSGVARNHGYLFARSSIPAQTLAASVLHIRLDEGRVDEVRLSGSANAGVRHVLDALTGHAPKRDEVERQLLLAADLPGVSIGKVSYAIEGGRGILQVPVSQQRLTGEAGIDNRGLEALGPVRARVSVVANGLLGDSDMVTLQALGTPLQPRELAAFYGRYAIQPTASGTEFGLSGSYGRTRSGGRSRAFDAKGESSNIAVTVSHPLERSKETSVWVTALGDRTAVNDYFNGSLNTRDRITTVGLSIGGYTAALGGRLRASAGVTQGLLALGATRRDDYYASRYDAGSDFTTLGLSASWTGRITGPFSARLATAAQFSSNPLPAVQQITIGGPYYGRGYDFSERTGDEGVVSAAELRARVVDRNAGLVRSAEVYSFADAGRVMNLKTTFGTGHLYSTGLGARFGFAGRLSLELEAAFPINEIRYDSGDKSPRLSFSLGTRF